MGANVAMAVDAWLEEMEQKFKAACEATSKELKTVLEKRSAEEIKLANAQFGIIQQNKILNAFRKAVDEWYGAYSPSVYSRSGGLYDVIDIGFDADGIVIDEPIEMLYNSGASIGDGRQGGLFQQVFVEGWHGGSNGSHRYRYPVPYYTYAGRVAVQTESADSLFRSAMSGISAELDNEFERLHRSYQEVAVNDALKAAMDVWNRYIN